MKRFVLLIAITLALGLSGFAQQLPATSYGAFDAAFGAPALSGVGLGTITYTAGSIYQGGTLKSIVAGTIGTLGASKTDCSAPLYASCDIIYWTSGTGLSMSATFNTATAAGNNVVAFVTTDGSSLITAITPVSLSLTQPDTAWNLCGATTTCAKTANGTPVLHVTGSGVGTTTGVATITALPFSNTNYICSGFVSSATGATPTGGVIPLVISATSAKFTVTGNTGTDTTVGFVCDGN